MPYRLYTPQEDKLIMAASPAELTGLAARLGRKRHNIVNRRTKLLRGDDLHAPFRKPGPEPSPERLTSDVLAGRPKWFEDVGTLHARLRAGR